MIVPGHAIPLDQNTAIRWQFVSNSTTSVFRKAYVIKVDGTLTPYLAPSAETITANRSSQVPAVAFPNPLSPGLGWLIAVSAGVNFGVVRGQIYSQIRLQDGAGNTIQTLVADYLTGGKGDLSWPGSPLRDPTEGPGWINNNAPGNPASATDITITVPSNARWRIIDWRITLTTSASVGNRNVGVIVDDGTNNLRVITNAWLATLAASATGTFSLGEGGISEGQQALTNTQVLLKETLGAGFRLRTSTAGLLAGDQFSSQLMIEEWLAH